MHVVSEFFFQQLELLPAGVARVRFEVVGFGHFPEDRMLHEVRAFEPASVLACVVFVRDSLDVVIGLAFAASYALTSGKVLRKRTTMLEDCIGNRTE